MNHLTGMRVEFNMALITPRVWAVAGGELRVTLQLGPYRSESRPGSVALPQPVSELISHGSCYY